MTTVQEQQEKPNKVAYVSLAGIVMDGTRRFALAQFVKDYLTREGSYSQSMITDLYWRTALNGAYIQLDTPILGAKEALDTLEKADFTIVFLSANPEHMRADIENWLEYHKIRRSGRFLVLKPESEKYTRTLDWKVNELLKMARSDENTHILLVDDEVRFHTALMMAASEKYHMAACSTLAEATQFVDEVQFGKVSF